MAMTQVASNANQKIATVLAKVLDLHYLGTTDNDVVILKLDTFLDGIDLDETQLMHVLKNLSEKKVIKSSAYPFKPDEIANICYVTVPRNFRTLAENHIKELGKLTVKATPGSILYLKDGDLWHGDKEDNICYPMSATKDRLAMVKIMTENKGYQTTKSIALALGKTEQNVRTEIAKIKAKIKHHLDLDDLIESSKGQGYRINPKYKITIIK